ncbi:dynein heavy chain 14, axonemal-like [Molossus molossus]|uniref:dynein heavy chain 14, axonemal-like n=1 Tax=Molossus molossus TaxID=27622 RepID=UPI001746CF64|nr:dynein heavy chain 14, axonemal-like [Molossus molossus]
MEMIQTLSREAAGLANKVQLCCDCQDCFSDAQAHMHSLSVEEITQVARSEISDIELDLTLRRILWASQEEWRALFQRWRSSALRDIDVESVQRNVAKCMSVISALEKGLPRNNMVMYLKQSVTSFKQELPIITALGNPCLKPRHWAALQEIIGKSVSLDKNCTVENLLMFKEYMEIKRVIFPRFYFLSNAELLAILAESENPDSVQPHLVKCFENIKRLLIWKQTVGPPTVTMLISDEGETLVLPKKIRVRSAVEQWLINVEKSMFDVLKKFVKQGIEDWNHQPFSLWVVSHPGQVVLTVSQIIFYNDCVESFVSSHAKEELEKVHAGIMHHLDEVAKLVVLDTSNTRTKTVLGALFTIYVHCRDIVRDLLLKNIFNAEDFEWTRCWLTLTGALRLNLGGCPTGPAGTGKTESIKDLAKALGKHCVVFNCFEDLDYKIMGKFFLGLVQSGAWCCFDEFNQTSVEALSVIASQIQTIKAAKDSYSVRFVLEGREVRINMSCAVIVTMNYGYKGRVDLPDNLKSLFRPVSMVTPHYQKIAEITLFSVGFKSAKLLSRKLVILHELASKQLSQQDHYNFGLRSLKTTIILAGKKKQKFKCNTSGTLSETDESLIIIEAVRESSLPKFIAEDVLLFETILGDIFPEATVSKVNQIDLEKVLSTAIQQLGLQQWPAQKEKIIQFHNQLQASVGVMLVGPTGGGKTTVRRILERALMLLPVEDVLSINERESISQIIQCFC